MLSLKLQRRVQQESCKSEIPVRGGIADVGVFIHIPRRIIIVEVNSRVSVGGVRATVLDLSTPVTLWGRGIDGDHPIGVTQDGTMNNWGISRGGQG